MSYFHHHGQLSRIHKKTGIDLQLITNHPVFKFEA
ncbi:hypothetical protein LRU_00657 [Ligilactobacillus ruminis SPM0211]|uniref:Uncharacterized protein n=1 Tax=Ligilactobacillus ruminis SPM0211 TaxID=1040964 RepID=F7QZ16_9LACO|nr:hypothetical protein LRU_00657 [Ligilactobacillus ruminis SPM0211]